MEMQTKKKHRALRGWLIALACLVVVVVIALGAIGNYLVTYAIGRTGDGGNRQVALEVDEDAVSAVADARTQNMNARINLARAFAERVPEEPVDIAAADGLPLHAGLWAQADSHRWVIAVHGYRSNHYGMLGYAARFHEAGWNVLAPDMRGCGETGGDYVGMGWPDRLDVLRWVDWIVARDAQAQIVIFGVSMGGATTMMVSGEPTPDAVVAFVEDCGYTSVWDIFASELGLRFHLPAFPVLDAASLISKLRAGYSFREASSLDQVAKCDKPMLFIHGDQDNFVPFWMLQMVYDAKPGENKRLVEAKGAGHGMAWDVLGEDYWTEIFTFVNAYAPAE